MNSQELITQAIQCFSLREYEKGKQLLKQAADSGSPSAVLFYADVLFKQDKQAAYNYLGQQAEFGVSGVLHRRALLRCFFDVQRDTETFKYICDDLVSDAETGGLQSIFAMLSVIKDTNISAYYKYLLFKQLPEVYALLVSDDAPSGVNAKPADDLIAKAFLSGINAWQHFDMQVLNAEIGLQIAKAALSDFECRYMLQRFSSLVQPSMVYDPATGLAKHDAYRTGAAVAIVPEYLDWITLAIEYKMAIFSGTERRNGEVMNMIHYLPKQYYLPHFDAIVGDTSSLKAQLANGGQRQRTILAYLNTVSAGGETSFSKLKIKVKPYPGDLITFLNVDKDGKLLQKSYHAGEEVLEGEKWLLSKWVRQSVTDYGTVVYGK
ncbi:2OG-Fe(II) oxygenase [Rheinheimera fenheensis]|uniref:2OG-Fe(II) oxygenase n=1 Tax=Rheinheimera fenheensis TaxID=3152295 RepID=UPI00325D0C0A